MQNLLQWKRKRAEHKKLIKESKKKSWIEFVTSLNYETPGSALYQKMRRIKGKAQRKVNILREWTPIRYNPGDRKQISRHI